MGKILLASAARAQPVFSSREGALGCGVVALGRRPEHSLNQPSGDMTTLLTLLQCGPTFHDR
jgi:hypothetical protein